MTSKPAPPRINLEHITWTPSGSDPNDPDSRLLGHISIGGTLHTIQAISVHTIDGQQIATDPDFNNEVLAAHTLAGEGSQELDTVTINTREYILIMIPFSN